MKQLPGPTSPAPLWASGKLFANPSTSYLPLLGMGWWWVPRWQIYVREGWG